MTVLAIGIPAHDEEGSIERMLQSLVRQTLWRELAPQQKQVVVCANGCSDRTAEVVRAFAGRHEGVEVFEIPGRGKSQAWNLLCRRLRPDAPWWVFADADVILHRRALEHLFATASAHPEAAVISSTLVSSARYVPPERRGPLIAARIESERWKQLRSEVSARLYLIRSDVARAIVLPPGLLNEDLYLTRLLGADRIVRSRQARVFNREPRTLADLVRYQLRTRIGSFQARELIRSRSPESGRSEGRIGRSRGYRRLSARAWLGKALWLPIRLYIEWRARWVRVGRLSEDFWIEIRSAKLGRKRASKPASGSFCLAPGIAGTDLEPVLLEPQKLLGAAGARLLKDHRRTAVACVPLGGIEVFVKRFKPYAWYRRLESRIASPARIAWANAELLERHGFRVPRVLAAVEQGADSYLVAERVEGAEPAADFWLAGAGGEPGIRRRIAERAALVLRRLHRSGLYSRDANANNFLVRLDSEGEPEFFFLDLECLRRPLRVGWRRQAKNLVQFYRLFRGRVSRATIVRFLYAYFGLSRPLRNPEDRKRFRRRMRYLRRLDLRKEAEYRRRQHRATSRLEAQR
jgi:glycosyltransferase involved in cell wall biosynthesis